MSDKLFSSPVRKSSFTVDQDAGNDILSVERSIAVSTAARKELEEYLNYMSEKRGSDGKALIKVPPNFDSIANSMNREDLVSTSETPWCQYLFQDSFDTILREEFDGRYNTYLSETPNIKISKGLAQIQLLDRQLQEIARKDPLRPPPVSGMLTDRSDSFHAEDKTFLTKKGDEMANMAHDGVVESHEVNTVGDSVSQRQEQQRRLEELLSMDDDEFEARDDFLQALSELARQSAQLDARLQTYGHMDRLIGDPEISAGRDSVLARQRNERLETQQMARLSCILKELAAPVDLTGLMAGPHSWPTPSSRGSTALELPDPARVNAATAVTMGDLHQVISEVMARHSDDGTPLDALTRQKLQQLLRFHRPDIDRLAALRSTSSSSEHAKVSNSHEWETTAGVSTSPTGTFPVCDPEDLRLPPIPALYRRVQQRTHPQRHSDLGSTAQQPNSELPRSTVFHRTDALLTAVAPDGGSSGINRVASVGRIKAVVQTAEQS